MNKIILIVIVLILFFFTVINFIGINESFNTNNKDDSINSNIVVLNRILRTSNMKELKQKYNSLSSFNL